MAQIGDPVPRKHALDPDDDILQIREYELKEYLRIGIDILVQNDFA